MEALDCPSDKEASALPSVEPSAKASGKPKATSAPPTQPYGQKRIGLTYPESFILQRIRHLSRVIGQRPLTFEILFPTYIFTSHILCPGAFAEEDIQEDRLGMLRTYQFAVFALNRISDVSRTAVGCKRTVAHCQHQRDTALSDTSFRCRFLSACTGSQYEKNYSDI